MAIDLPVPFGHIIFAGIQRLTVEDTDTPVIFGRGKLLGKQDGRLVEQQIECRFQLRFICHFLHTEREGTVRYFQDEWRAQLVADLFKSVFVRPEDQHG